MQRPDLAHLESTLINLSVSSIVLFAQAHRDESFYAFGLDCHAAYGLVLLCLNTEHDFARTAQTYIADWQYGPKELAGLRKNFGDWQYQGFNTDEPNWAEHWDPLARTIEEYVFSEDTPGKEVDRFIEEFMQMVCRVLLKLETTEAFSMLQRDEKFFTQAIDHDEEETTATIRLIALREG